MTKNKQKQNKQNNQPESIENLAHSWASVERRDLMVLCCAVMLPSASSSRTPMLAKRASLTTTFFPLSLLLLELLFLFCHCHQRSFPFPFAYVFLIFSDFLSNFVMVLRFVTNPVSTIGVLFWAVVVGFPFVLLCLTLSTGVLSKRRRIASPF